MKNEKKKLSLSTILSYAMATGSGYQIMGAVVGSYLLVFLTDTFGVPAGAAGVIMVIASIWDAINDPIMGVLADRTKSKMGKYRPYFLIAPALLSIAVVLLFASPNLNDTGKIIWTAVFYILYGMLRTAIEIPSSALINAITDEQSERTKLISAFTITMGIFTTISSSFALNFVSIFGGENTAKGYMWVVGIAGVIMTLSCWWCFASTKELGESKAKTTSLSQELKQLLKVKELIPVILAWVAGYTSFNIMMGSSVYYMLYYICRPDLISYYMLDISLVGVVGIAVFVPVFMKLFKSVKKAFAVAQIGVAVCSIILFFFGKNIIVLFVFSGIGSIFATLFMPFAAMLMSEMTDYILVKSNSVMNGTIAALKGFANKCGIAISSAVISFMLAASGYIAGAVGEQPDAVLLGLRSARFLVPVICAVIIVVSLRKYPVDNSIREKIKALYDNSKGEKDK